MVRSLLDRRLMGLADRGGSSGFVGQAWGGICRTWLTDQVGRRLEVTPDLHGTVRFVLDLDAMPRLPAFASSRGLANPDFIVGLDSDDGTVLVAADAKFSIETAKPRQVSAEILTALLETPGTPIAVDGDARGRERDGIFITPDYELTRLVMTGTMGIQRTAVAAEQVYLLDVDPARLIWRSDLHESIGVLAPLDDLISDWRSDTVAALYYARCAFACIGSRIDETRPLLGRSAGYVGEDPGLLPELLRRAQTARSAWHLVQRWDRDAEEVREIRVRIHQAAELAIANRDLRTLVERDALKAGIAPPSMNRVRRDLAKWVGAELEQQYGMIYFPVADVDGLVARLRRSVAELHPAIPAQVRQIVSSIAAES
jgi:hypothetical protein